MVEEVGDGLYIADLDFQGLPDVIASFILASDGELGLVETGPATTLPRLLAAIEPFGGLDRLQTIVVTHIHLDHAGAVGELLARAPHVRCYVHHMGAPHLVDPSRLLRSATRIYGNRMEQLWGQVRPAPQDQVVTVDDGDLTRIGGRDLRVIYTPGHASHHIALWSEVDRLVFTGDVAGVRLPGWQHVRPPTPPPEVDPIKWSDSVGRLRRLEPEGLLLTHYGLHSQDIGRHLTDVLERLDAWIDVVRTGLQKGESSEALVAKLRAEADGAIMGEGGDAETVRRYELASPYGMSVDGLLRYLQQEDEHANPASLGTETRV